VIREIEGWIENWMEMNPDSDYPGRNRQEQPTPKSPPGRGLLELDQT